MHVDEDVDAVLGCNVENRSDLVEERLAVGPRVRLEPAPAHRQTDHVEPELLEARGSSIGEVVEGLVRRTPVVEGDIKGDGRLRVVAAEK